MQGLGTWRVGVFLLAVLACGAAAATLELPERPANAPSGSELIPLIERMTLDDREGRLWNAILRGNVPAWNRRFIPLQFSQVLNGSNHTVVFHVLPEYLAVGSDDDYFLAPMTPRLGQRLADRLGCMLPTRKMVNIIWTNATVKLKPQPIPPSDAMITVPVFAAHNSMIREQRNQHTNSHPFGALVAGHKKDVVISSRIYTNFSTATRRPVVIYGWHNTSGQPIQPLYNGHSETYADYSHGIRLVLKDASLNGTMVSIPALLMSDETAAFFSDEGAAEGTNNGVIATPGYREFP
jgi:hypothetical protein